MSYKKACYISMTSVSLIVLITILSSCATEGAVFSQRALVHPAYPGKCINIFTRQIMLPGKVYKPKGICASLTCDVEEEIINIETCSTVEMRGCEPLPPNPSLKFPKCCPQFKCTDIKTGEETVYSA